MPTTVAAWPISTIPLSSFKLDGFRLVEQDDVIRFQPEVGESIDRVRHTAVPYMMPCVVRTSKANAQALDTFYRVTLSRVGRFTMTDPFLETTQTFKFAAPPEFSKVGGDVWDVSLTLVRLP